MKVRFIIASKMKDDPYRGIIDEFIKRLTPYVRCELIDFKVADKLNTAKALTMETEKLLELSKGYYRVAMDPKGQLLSTEKFSNWFSDCMNSGQDVAFLIGSAYGLDEALKNKADRLMSLSALTMAHKVAMVVLAEQVYRAITIIKGHPYHK